jgi:hypothetical protein
MSFSSGNYNSSHKDAHGFWLTGAWTTTTNIAANTTSITAASYTLNNSLAGQFSQWTLTTWMRIEYTVDGGATQLLYIDPSSNVQWSMPNTTLSLGSNLSGTIPNNSDGTCTFTIKAYCDAVTDASYVPTLTTAYSVVTTTPVPRGKKYPFDGTSTSYINTYKRFDGANWVDVTTRKRFDGTNWIDI